MDSSDESVASGHHEARPRRNRVERQQPQHNPILNEEGNIVGWQRFNQDQEPRQGQDQTQAPREERRRKGDTHSKVAETLQLITRELQSMKEEHQQSKIRSPTKSLWLWRASGTPSATSCSIDLPTARASGWAKKFDMSSSWLDTGSDESSIGVWD